jgi:predicted regulator of Ras-like GTPase activity (Roadblock/LC7/MglB family)
MSVMSNSVKTKFAGLLRGLLRRLDDNEVSEATAPPAPRRLTSVALPAGAAPVAAAAPQRPPAASTLPASSPPPAPVENPDNLQLPLQPILAAMPMDLRAKVMQAPPLGMILSIPLEKILTQLAFGSVKITFGELRQAVPGVFVNSGGEHDHKTVTLPLNEILTRLNPARLSRRPVQKHLEVAEEIAGPFGAGGQGVTISTGTKPTPSTSMTSRAGTPPLRMVAPVAPAASQPAPVTPPPPAFVPRAITPAAGITAPPPPSLTSHDTTHLNNGAATPRSNGVTKPFVPASPVAPPPAPPATVPAPPLAAPAAQMPAESAAIFAPLSALSEQWPEGLRLEIIQSNLAHAQVLLPMNVIEPALKRGRITFTWRNLRALIKPTPPAASIHDGIELDLPLSVVAPLFFTRQKGAARTQPASRPPSDIPNLFFGFPQSEPAPPQPPAKKTGPHSPQLQPAQPTPLEPPPSRPQPVQPTSPEPPSGRPQPVRPKPPEPQLHRPVPEPQSIRPLPDPRPAIRPALKPVDDKLVDSNYYIWANDNAPAQVDETEYKHSQRPATDFTSRYATPKEIVERAMALPGVTGVLVALPDGLRVASQVPAEFNADTLAAFLPQIFDRVSQSTKELRMGALNNFNFTVGNVPWKIFRVNAVYFAAFGCAGEALPSAQLAALAAELDRKKS